MNSFQKSIIKNHCLGIGPTTIFVADVKPNNTVKVLAEFGQTSEREQELIGKKFPHVHFENITLSNGFGELFTLYISIEMLKKHVTHILF